MLTTRRQQVELLTISVFFLCNRYHRWNYLSVSRGKPALEKMHGGQRSMFSSVVAFFLDTMLRALYRPVSRSVNRSF